MKKIDDITDANYRYDLINNDESVRKDPIFYIVYATQNTYALLAAYEIKLFTLLYNNPMGLHKIATSLNIEERAVQAILSMCTSLGLLRIENDRYILSNISIHYLLPESPYYVGGWLDVALNNLEMLTYEKFKQSLLSNTAQVYNKQDLFKVNEQNTELSRTFTKAMHSKSMSAASIWPKLVNLSKHKVLLDIGGGSGAHTIVAVKYWPHLQGIIYERPLICEIAREFIDQSKLQNFIKTVEGNIWCDILPVADVHFYSDIFHDWPLSKCEFLAHKSYENLPKGGIIIIHELLFNDDKSGPTSTSLYNYSMLLYTQGQQYSVKEITSILTKVGFKKIKITFTGFGDWSIITGVKS